MTRSREAKDVQVMSGLRRKLEEARARGEVVVSAALAAELRSGVPSTAPGLTISEAFDLLDASLPPGRHQGNHLLEALPPSNRQRLIDAMVPVSLPVKTVLFDAGEPITSVYFPLDGVISLVTPLEDGGIVEVATVGNEGIVGVPLIAGRSLLVRAIAQVAGCALRMEAGAFLKQVGPAGPVRTLVQNYLQALFTQIAQAAACNRLHTNEERLSRWLLMSHDRVGVDQFAITHEFLAQMLGSRRATVTLSAGILQAAGLIRYHRGHVTILDRPGLERVACECYAVIKADLDHVTQRAS